MEFVSADELAVPQAIIDSIVLANLGDTNTSAVGFGNRWLGLLVVDTDAAMRKQCTHPNSLARGDVLVLSTDLEIKVCAAGHGYALEQFVICQDSCRVDSKGYWGKRWNAEGQQDNPDMLAA